jgi:hypothetical protein
MMNTLSEKELGNRDRAISILEAHLGEIFCGDEYVIEETDTEYFTGYEVLVEGYPITYGVSVEHGHVLDINTGEILYFVNPPTHHVEAEYECRKNELAECLEDAMEDLKEKMEEVQGLLRDAEEFSTEATRRAMAYWFPHIVCALDDDNPFAGSAEVTMKDTINELRED